MQVDVACVSATCTFASVATLADLCHRLNPSPSSDKCEQAEAQLMSLMLNICRLRVAEGEGIQSSCSGHTTVGQSRADADAQLCNPMRGQAACTSAQCECEEINSGRALGTTSLRVQKLAGGGVGLSWSPPYSSPDFEAPQRYRVFRRAIGQPVFAQIGETSLLSFTDAATTRGASYEYEVTVVW